MSNADVYIKTEYRIGEGQQVVLSGDTPELGCWHEEFAIQAMPLEPLSEGVHLVIIKLPMNKPMNWKWAIADDDVKIQKWEDYPNRHLYIDRKLMLIDAPWGRKENIMDKSVKNYEFVPSSVLFDIAWQKAMPKRRMYKPNTTKQNRSSPIAIRSSPVAIRSSPVGNRSSPVGRERNDPLTKDMMEAKARMIELQRKWSETDRSQSMEEFLKKGYNEYLKTKGRQSPAGSSPKRVTFQERPSIVGESSTESTSFPSPADKCQDCSQQRLERPKSAKFVQQQQASVSVSPEPRLRPDAEARVCEYLKSLEGEKKRRDALGAEGRAKEDEEMEKEEKEAVVTELSPVPRSRSQEKHRALVVVTGALGCAILVMLGYYVYKKHSH